MCLDSLGRTRASILVMKLFISTLGLTKKVVAIYSNIYVKKVRLINHAVRIEKQAQGLLRTVSVFMSVRMLLMIKVEWVIGRLTWLLAKVTVTYWSRL
jgi:hypothetical protein